MLAAGLTGCGSGGGTGISSLNPAVSYASALNRTTVFVGDSITEDWALPVHNQGISGQFTAQMLARFGTDVLGHGYARVVILGGTNDVWKQGNATAEDVTANLAAMAGMAQAAGLEVVLCKLPPLAPGGTDLSGRVDAVNAAIAQLSVERGYVVVDYATPMKGHPEFFSDGVHPNGRGYGAMETALATAVVK